MKNTFQIGFILIAILFSYRITYTQTTESKLSQILLAKNKELAPLQLAADVYPFLFFTGSGGSVGLEFNRWHTGITGFTVKPPEFIKTIFFRNAEDITIEQNDAIEIFVSYYLRPDRKGLYFGVIGGPEWFKVKDDLTNSTETIVKSYVLPRVGLRVFPFKRYFYVDASVGWSFNLRGTEQRTLGETTYNASAGGLLNFFQLGVRLPLTKQD